MQRQMAFRVLTTETDPGDAVMTDIHYGLDVETGGP
jgi:hypothetical protein